MHGEHCERRANPFFWSGKLLCKHISRTASTRNIFHKMQTTKAKRRPIAVSSAARFRVIKIDEEGKKNPF